jgi:hypothetical protein
MSVEIPVEGIDEASERADQSVFAAEIVARRQRLGRNALGLECSFIHCDMFVCYDRTLHFARANDDR